MKHTPDQKTRMTTLEWAMTFILGHHDGRPLTGPVLAAAALPLAQWVSEVGNITDLGPEPTPDFDADELPTIEIPGEVYVGGRRADGVNPDEDETHQKGCLCAYCGARPREDDEDLCGCYDSRGRPHACPTHDHPPSGD